MHRDSRGSRLRRRLGASVLFVALVGAGLPQPVRGAFVRSCRATGGAHACPRGAACPETCPRHGSTDEDGGGEHGCRHARRCSVDPPSFELAAPDVPARLADAAPIRAPRLLATPLPSVHPRPRTRPYRPETPPPRSRANA